MDDKQIIKFTMYEMEFKGNSLKSDLQFIPFDEKYYEQYKNLIDNCFYEMRKLLNLRPYEKHSLVLGALDELIKQKEDIFLYLDGDEIICAVTCYKNEIGNVAVNLKYQRQGYGRKLMEFALSYMQKRGDCPIRLTVTKWNQNAVKLYKSLRFEIVKEITVEGINFKAADGDWKFKFIDTGGLNVR